MRTDVLEATPGWDKCCLEVTRGLCWSFGGDRIMVFVMQGTAFGYREPALVFWWFGALVVHFWQAIGKLTTNGQPWTGQGTTKKQRSRLGGC